LVLIKEELIASLQNEVRILLHLAGKIDRNQLDYRPGPKQRSTIELLRYLTVMGPELIAQIHAGAFDMPGWEAALAGVSNAGLDEVLASIQAQPQRYAELIDAFSEADLRGEVEMFFRKSSRGSLLVNMVLSGCAAYRAQLFLYLKACGREELGTMNLWAGTDAAAAA